MIIDSGSSAGNSSWGSYTCVFCKAKVSWGNAHVCNLGALPDFNWTISTSFGLPESVVALLQDELRRSRATVAVDAAELARAEEMLEQRREWHEMAVQRVEEIELTLRQAGIDPIAEPPDGD